jgi:hypothetical protein
MERCYGYLESWQFGRCRRAQFGLLIGQASAMPANGLATVAGDVSDSIHDVRWVCGPYRCWWRPGWWGPHYYGYGGPHTYWGWRHGWRHWS